MEAIRGWRWENAPGSSLWVPIGGSAAYLAAVAALLVRRQRREGSDHLRAPPNGASMPADGAWRVVLTAHNVVLSVLSLAMLVGVVAGAVERAQQSDSIDWVVCEAPSHRSHGLLGLVAYAYYLSKFLEFGDTLLALGKGTLPPHLTLHVFHHALVPLSECQATARPRSGCPWLPRRMPPALTPLVARRSPLAARAAVSWLWLEHAQSLRFAGLAFNSLVHVVMYAYYAMRAAGLPAPWWKRYITQLQIVQFMTSLVLVTMLYYAVFMQGRECAGMGAVAFNVAFNVTLLFQFIGVAKTNDARAAKKKQG